MSVVCNELPLLVGIYMKKGMYEGREGEML
jgi:hypothetical protein